MERGRRWLGGLTEKPQGQYPFQLGRWDWAGSLAYSVDVLYQGMKKGWKDLAMPIIMCGHSIISALSIIEKCVEKRASGRRYERFA